MKRVFCFAVLALFFVSLPSCAKKTQPKPQEKETPDNTDPQDPQDPQQEESDTNVISLENLDQTDVNTSGSNGNSGNEGKKKVSLLGDSITTYQGYTPYPNNYQYPKSSYTDFTSVSQTWWHQLIYGKMSDAEREIEEARYSLQRFSKELRDVTGYSSIHIDEFLTFADFVFDGLLADVWVQSKISKAKEQCDDAIVRVSQIKSELEARLN